MRRQEWPRIFGLVCRVAGPASSVGVERREREGPREDGGGRGAGNWVWRGKEEGTSRRKETMKTRNGIHTMAGIAFQCPPRLELDDY